MEILSRFFRRRERPGVRSDIHSLKEQVASNIKMFISIRGRDSLLNTETAIVMRKNFETFVTDDVLKIENSESVAAIIYLKDMGCYEQVKTTQADGLLRGSILAPLALNYLAAQVASELQKKSSNVGHPPVFKKIPKQSIRSKNG
jgi:hypothetical protein